MALSKIGGNQIDSAASLTVSGNLSADGGTIKLDGNYPTGTNNVALGDAALGGGSLSGGSNVAIGTSALDANTSGTTNIAIGVNALGANTTASDNVAVGHSALKVNTTGTYNTAVGYEALDANTTANNNTAVGYGTLTSNTTGSGNNAFGYSALFSNTTGSNNTTVGANALDNNTTASNNTAVGHQSLGANTTASKCTAVGTGAAKIATTAAATTAFGYNAGVGLTTANNNTFIGAEAGTSTTGAANTFVGRSDNGFGAGHYVTTGSKNVILGGYHGNESSVDIRTSSTNVILSDGDGKIRFYSDNGDSTAIGHSGDNMLLIDDTRIASSTVTMSTVDNAMANGWSNRRWTVVYAVSGSINTSDENEKQDIEALSDAETRVATACKGLIKKYRWREAVTKKGDDARIHVGVIAQELKAAFEAEGLDANRYGMFCSDTWWEKDETIDGVVHTKDYATEDAAPDGATKVTRLGVRYEELLAFIISAM